MKNYRPVGEFRNRIASRAHYFLGRTFAPRSEPSPVKRRLRREMD